jgi:hypothetical protein
MWLDSELTIFVDANEQMIKLLNALGHESYPALSIQALRLGWHYDEHADLEAPVMAEDSLIHLKSLNLHVDVSPMCLGGV